MFIQINVWRNYSKDQTAVYRIFQDLESNLFFVQNCDFFTFPIQKKQISDFENQALILFHEIQPNKRTKGFRTIKEAIISHDKQFEN